MQFFFALTLLVSAMLLFLVQPMFAKMVLPLLGGTPAVWNTCMVFYQAMLLGGYLYAHFSTKLLGTRRQAVVHLVLLLLPWVVLPIAVAKGWTPPGDAPNPIPWLLMLLTLSVGLPFFVVSASAPMLQAWFADTGHPAGKDPYFLYAASNLGSMLALLGYPVIVERYLPLFQQSWVWAIGYGSLMLLTLGCAVFLRRSRGVVAASASAGNVAAGQRPMTVAELEKTLARDEANGAPTLALRLRWLALSFAPSSLLLGVTTYITTDIASFALLWVIPLALYLLTFVLVFAQWPTLLHRLAARWLPGHPTLVKVLDPHWILVWIQPILVAVLALVIYETASSEMGNMILLHLTAFFVTAMVCHGELARSRPAASHLTEFYIWMSVGGVLGGMFNALIAPLVFPTVVEYPVAIAIACMLRPTIRLGVPGFLRPLGKRLEVVSWSMVSRWLDILLPLAVFGILFGLNRYQQSHHDDWNKIIGWANGNVGWLNRHVGDYVPLLDTHTAVLGVGILLSFFFLFRPIRFGMTVGAVLLAGHLWFCDASNVVYTDRSFFGVMRIKQIPYTPIDMAEGEGPYYWRTLLHGSTNHGEQKSDPIGSRQPITYYFESGPIGEILTKLIDPVMHKEIGIAGLGTGTTAAYGKTGQRITYFEIDPHVVRIAKDPKFFSYVTDFAADVQILLGDARLSLEEKIPDKHFDLLLMDAFSSDAIPMHMITKEAIELYFRKLKDNGILIVHTSNRHLALKPVVGNVAKELGLVARYRDDLDIDPEESAEGKFPSDAVVVVRDLKRLGSLANDRRWQPIAEAKKVGVWTDDYSNVLSVVRWLHPEMDEDDFADEGDKRNSEE